jgi:hypothetical protein
MKHDRRLSAGMGLAVLVAGFTLAIAVVAGIFLIRDWNPDQQPYAQLEWPAPVTVTAGAPPHTDHLRAKPQRLARISRAHRGNRA